MTNNRAHKQDWAALWTGVGARFLPFADVASDELPLGRLLRLSLFQVSVGMTMTLLTGAINRVMIVELGVYASLVALMVSLPLVFAPFRALIGHKSDTHRSALGWRRGPYIWFGSLMQFGGLAIMPFALLVLSGDAVNGPQWIGQIGAALAFLLVGAGLHTTQTAGLALATDIAPHAARPRVVALLYVMLLVGMGLSALIFGALLKDFTQLKLIQVIQGSAVVAIVFNVVALWKQEARDPSLADREASLPKFSTSWRKLLADARAKRLFAAVGIGAAAFSMQDVLLEPYGGEILGLSVSQTTILTALFAAGTLAGFALAGRMLQKDMEPHRLAAIGALIGIVAFSLVVFAEPLQSALMFRFGATLIGFGGGLFSVCTLTSVMSLADQRDSGLVLGAWGAVQATAAGVAIALGGVIRDLIGALAANGGLAAGFDNPALGYSVVYHLEIFLLFMALAAIGPLARMAPPAEGREGREKFGIAAFPT